MNTLVEFVKKRLTPQWHKEAKEVLDAFLLNVARYPQKTDSLVIVRSPQIDETGIPYCALIHPDNATSGPYGGMSFVLFPSKNVPALISMVVGTQGIAPDENVLGRPGHARKLSAICTLINRKFGHGNRIAWAKKDPCRTDIKIPENVVEDFQDEAYQNSFKKYGNVDYALVNPVGLSDEALDFVLKLFLFTMLEERGFPLKKDFEQKFNVMKQEYLSCLLPDITLKQIEQLLDQRKYVIIEGPPGTGKTRLAQQLAERYVGKKCIQFHPNMTYEQFIGGLFPIASNSSMGFSFQPHPGALMESIQEARALPKGQNYLLHIDEINRADLAKVLGEAILLFEPNSDLPRTIDLNYNFPKMNGKLSIPENLHVIGTMNSADRSIAILDIAIRRRFAFVRLYPQMHVVQELGDELTKDAFAKLLMIFVEHASDDSFKLMPGHSYFIVKPGTDSRVQLKTELLPLLEEYIEQGYVAGFEDEIRSYIQNIEIRCEA